MYILKIFLKTTALLTTFAPPLICHRMGPRKIDQLGKGGDYGGIISKKNAILDQFGPKNCDELGGKMNQGGEGKFGGQLYIHILNLVKYVELAILASLTFKTF